MLVVVSSALVLLLSPHELFKQSTDPKYTGGDDCEERWRAKRIVRKKRRTTNAIRSSVVTVYVSAPLQTAATATLKATKHRQNRPLDFLFSRLLVVDTFKRLNWSVGAVRSFRCYDLMLFSVTGPRHLLPFKFMGDGSNRSRYFSSRILSKYPTEWPNQKVQTRAEIEGNQWNRIVINGQIILRRI